MEHRRKADNHVGWCVESWTASKGWKGVSKIYGTWLEAMTICTMLQGTYRREFRVYEVVK